MDTTRFDRVRATAAYRVACLEDLPKSTIRVSGMIAMLAILGPLVALLAVVKPVAAVTAGLVTLIGIASTITSLVIDRRTPVNRQLSIVASTWSGLRGSPRNQRVARSVTLRDVYGIERDFHMPAQVVGDAIDGAIGLAIIRRGTVIRFVNLDAVA